MKGLLFTYALTYGGAVVSLFNPWYGLLIYICFAIIKPESLWHWSVPAGNYSRIVAIALLIGWANSGFGNWNFGRGKRVVAALLAYLGWSALSAAFSLYPDTGWHFVEQLLKIALPFLVGITLIDSIDKLKQLTWVIMLSQGYVAFDLNMSYFQGYNRLYFAGFGGMDNNCVAIAMVCGAGLAFFLGLREPVWWRKLLAFSAAALMAHSIMFAFSRGGMLGLMITGLVSFVLIPKQPKHYAWFALAVVIGIRLAGPQVVSRFATTFADAEERDTSAARRIDMWHACCQMMGDAPLLGIGPDHFPLLVKDYGLNRGTEAHSLWLQIGAELGIVGLLLLVTFYGHCLLSLRPLAQGTEAADSWYADSARMVIAGLVGFTVSAQFVSLEGLELPYYVTLIGAGTLKLTSLEEQGVALEPGGWETTAAAI